VHPEAKKAHKTFPI